jgi:hypothetical protein
LIFNLPPTTANYLNVLPFAIDGGSIVGAVNTAPRVVNDLYSRIASCYVYSRGGVRIKFIDNAAVTLSPPIAVWIDSRSAITATTRSSTLTWAAVNSNGTNSSTDRNNMSTVFYRAGYSGEVQVPQYARYHSRLNSECVSTLTNVYSNFGTDFSPPIAVTRNTLPASIVDTAVYRSISDDGNFGSFLSVPPMVSLTVAQT